MSWLARSIANSLRIDHDDGDDSQSPSPGHGFRRNEPDDFPASESEEEREGDLRGVKEDFTEFTETLTRQIWGVANFLAPPPNSHSQLHDHPVVSECNRSESPNPSISGDEDDESLIHARISTPHGNQFEFGGLFQGMDRRILHNQPVSGNYESCSSFHRFGLRNVDEGEDCVSQAVGLTDEVLTFAGNIAHHPETWLDYPIEEEEDFDDFPMSESQKRHAQAVEHLTPTLAALRIELCPAHMSVGFFWKVYFVLLHSRLNKQDAELLSTPEVVEARAKWMKELQKRAKKDSERFHIGHYSKVSTDLDEDFTPRSLNNEPSETFSSWTFASEPATSSTTADSDSEKQVTNTEIQVMDKSISDEKSLARRDDKNIIAPPISKKLVLNFDDDDDNDWPEDDCLGHSGTVIPVGIEEDVSFSDLEDDDCCIPVKSKPEFTV